MFDILKYFRKLQTNRENFTEENMLPNRAVEFSIYEPNQFTRILKQMKVKLVWMHGVAY